MHNIVSSLGQAKVFSKADLAQGYFQIPIREEDKEKTALVTANNTYVFTAIPMGMRNSPAFFQSLMDKVLGSFRYAFAFAYQDDVIIYSRTEEEHRKHIDQVLTALQQANLSIKLTKSQFMLDSVEYLGFIVSSQGVTANLDKVKPIIQYQQPSNLTELERFLGMTGVYQRFISQYQVKTEPLRRLKKKDVEFTWGPEQEAAFGQLKKDLCLLPTLRQPDFSKTFELHTDAASSAGIAVILCQRQDNVPYPLAFASRALTIHEQRYSVREQECLAIIFGIKRFRPFLERKTFFIFTDHSSLQWILNAKDDVTARIWRWMMFLQSYQFEVFHVAGNTNHAADALSRHSVANVQAITKSSPLQDVDWSKVQQEDSDINDIISNLEHHKSFIMIENVLYKATSNKASNHSKDLCIVVSSSQVQSVCEQFYSSKFGGHFGFKKTKAKILQQRLWWSTMSQDIKEFCNKCDLCQRIKGGQQHQYNLSNTSSDLPFYRVSLDFFGPLPSSSSNNKYILVVMDCFTRFVEIYPVPSTTQNDIIHVFFSRYILRHELPAEILTDGGPPFSSYFFLSLVSTLDSNGLSSPPYHPQSNGTVERFMATLRRMIITYTEQETIKEHYWDQHLRIIQFVYNNTQHASTGFSPFYLVHGRSARFPLVKTNTIQEYDDKLVDEKKFANELQDRLNTAFDVVNNHLESKEYNTQENPYQVADQVLLFNQSLTSAKKPRKLQFDWSGPYEVSVVNTTSTVSLKQPGTNKRIYNVHVSRLKKYQEPN